MTGISDSAEEDSNSLCVFKVSREAWMTSICCFSGLLSLLDIEEETGLVCFLTSAEVALPAVSAIGLLEDSALKIELLTGIFVLGLVLLD